MAETFTEKLKLSKRDSGDLNWGVGHNHNFDLLDTYSQQGLLRPPRTLQISLGSGAVGTELLGNTIYFYKVTAINEAGETTASLIPSTLHAQINQPNLPQPVILQWELVKGATGYRIYKSTTLGQEKFLAEVLGESTLIYTDSGNASTNNSVAVPNINLAFTSVRKLLAGVGVTLNPAHGTGDVTINAAGGGGIPHELIGAAPNGNTTTFILEKYTTPYGSGESATFDLLELRNSFDQQQFRIRKNSNGYLEIFNSSNFEDVDDVTFYIEQGGDFPIYLRTNNNDVVRVLSSGVTFHSAYTFPNVDGSLGQVLSTDGNGNLSWITGGGGVNFPLISPDGAGFGYAFANGGANDVKMYFDGSANQIFFDIAGGQVQLAAGGEFDIYANGNNTSVELKENTHEIIFTSQSGQIFGIYGTWIQLNTDGRLRFVDGNSWVEFKQGPAMTGQTTYEWPNNDGASGAVLGTDGSGHLNWVSAPTPTFITTPTAQSYGYTANNFTLLTMDGSVIDEQGSGNPGTWVQFDTWAQLRLPGYFTGQGSRKPFVFYDDNAADYNSGMFLDGSNSYRLTLFSQNTSFAWSGLGGGYLMANQIGSQSDRLMNYYGSSVDLNGTLNAQRIQVDPNGNGEGISAKSFPVWFDNDENVKMQAEFPSGKLWLGTGTNPLDDNNFHVRFNFNNSSMDLAGGYKLAWTNGGVVSDFIDNSGGITFQTQSSLSVRDTNGNNRFNFGVNSGGDLTVSDDGGNSGLGRWEFRGETQESILKLVLMQNQVNPQNFNGTGIVFGRDSNPHFEIQARSTSAVFFDVKDYYGGGDARDSAMYFNIQTGGGPNLDLAKYQFQFDQNIRFEVTDKTARLSSSDGSGYYLDQTIYKLTIGSVAGYTIDIFSDTGGIQVDDSSTADETRFLLWDVTAGALKRVKRGAIDSGGTGLRTLVIDN